MSLGVVHRTTHIYLSYHSSTGIRNPLKCLNGFKGKFNYNQITGEYTFFAIHRRHCTKDWQKIEASTRQTFVMVWECSKFQEHEL